MSQEQNIVFLTMQPRFSFLSFVSLMWNLFTIVIRILITHIFSFYLHTCSTFPNRDCILFRIVLQHFLWEITHCWVEGPVQRCPPALLFFTLYKLVIFLQSMEIPHQIAPSGSCSWRTLLPHFSLTSGPASRIFP